MNGFMTTARVIAWALIAAGTVPACWFVASLHRRSRGAWRRDVMGRHLMGTMAALATLFAVVMLASVVVLATGNPVAGTWFVVPYLAGLAWVDAMLWRRLWHLWHPPQDSLEHDPGTSEGAHTS